MDNSSQYYIFTYLCNIIMELIAEQETLITNLKEIYYMRANECEKQWARDNAAALKIQSKFKMYIKRKEYLRKKAAAIKI